jgi:DNA-binding NarL/FixJ family response regulator
MESVKIKILIVEDHFLPRMALNSLINSQPDMETIAEAATGEQAVALFAAQRPDVMILDLKIPGVSGFEVLQQIRGEFPNARVVVLTNYEGSEDIYRCLQAGAMSYLLKDTSSEVLLNAIRAAHQGKRFLPQVIGEKLSERMPFSELTPRETDVLRLIVGGMSNQQIADALDIAEKTVRIHVSNVLAKLGVGDRTQAAIAALQRGIIHLD